MAEPIKRTTTITEQTMIAEDIYSMWVQAEDIASEAVPGQFVSLFCNDGSRLLPRPISICEIDRINGRLRLVYRVAGNGTLEFSKLGAGDELGMMGPLGNGFQLLKQKAILIGGGIGIPPMLELAKQLNCEKDIVLGYKDSLFLNYEFKPYGNVYLSTEDGSAGTRGNVLDAIKEKLLKADIIYACGPTPMLRGIKTYATEQGIRAQLSMEERMACGIGACLGCVCKTKEVDHHTNVKNKRICKEGPVFYADEVEI